LIEAAARRGVALFVEKPWATDLDHARELAALCEATGATVMVAFSFRYHPAIVKLRGLMDGDLGPGWMLNGQYVFRWAPPAGSWLWDPENGNGFFNENSCHLFDAVCYLMGDPVSVMAEAINPLDTPSEHAAALSVRFAGGVIAALTIGGIATGAYHAYPRIEVITADGQALLTGRDHIWERVSWAGRGDDGVREIVAPPEALGSTRYTHAFQHFFACIRTGQPPTCGVVDGVRAVALAMAVYESARTGKRIEIL
jgi:predicted dehydrogenase